MSIPVVPPSPQPNVPKDLPADDFSADAPPVRKRSVRTITAAAGGLIALAMGLLLMPVSLGGRLYSSLGDLCHTPLFMGLTLGGLSLLEMARPVLANRRPLIVRCMLIGSSLFCFGVGMELMQHYAGRTAAVHDAVANGMGVIIGVCFFMIWNRHFLWPRHASVKKWLVAVSLVALAIAWWNPLRMLGDEWHRRNEFPNLVSFDSEIEISRWYFRDSSAELTGAGATDGEFAMKASLPYQHSSITLVEISPDWTGIKQLDVDLLLPANQDAEQVLIELSIVDRHHKNYDTDLFKKVVPLRRGEPTHVTLSRNEIIGGPLDRELDLAAIKYFTVGLASRDAPVQIVVDAVKLSLQD